jgi:aminoglycoside phosphotransferase (APT) family kinase protein
MTQTSIKPFSSYPEDRERLRKLCDDVERDDDLSAAFALADLVGSILRDEEHLEEVTAEKRVRDAAPDLLAALQAADEADRLDDDARELCERADAEGWDREAGESHINAAFATARKARQHARQLRCAAIKRALEG